MFLIPAWAAMKEVARPKRSLVSTAIPNEWRWVFLAFVLLVGWRHEVGADWFNYLEHYYSANQGSEYLDWWLDDPGYRLLLWITVTNGWAVHALNLIGAVVFTYGLIVFCRSLARPWLALAVSVPYVVLVLGMGYSRQGFALGCIMVGLVALSRSRIAAFFVWVVIGATFHKSALLLLPIAVLVNSQRRVVTIISLAVVGFVSYGLLLERSVESLQQTYIDEAMQSQGALVRLLMNALPAFLFLIYRNRFDLEPAYKRLWFWFSVLSLVLCGVYFATDASTAVDRIGLYLLPIQLMVFACLPEVFGRNSAGCVGIVVCILLYYAAVEFVWLNYAVNAGAWIPYRFYPMEPVF